MEGTLNQPYIFAVAIYAGMLAGVIYLLFQAICKLFQMSNFLVVILDIAFIGVVFFVMALSMYFATKLSIRYYYFLGMLLGFFIFIGGIRPIGKKIYQIFTDKGKNPTAEVDNAAKKSSNNK